MSMASPHWRFREKLPAEQHQDPANTEFFAHQNVADRLVREATQNTLDAVRPGETARLAFSQTCLSVSLWERYFSTLWPHLEAQHELREALPNCEEPVPCLLVEDFGTSGLTGTLRPSRRAQQEENRHRLYWFFKNTGRTSKTGQQLGSFGIGKTVFPYSSMINSFFGLSVRETVADEPSIVLLGQSQLREHWLDSGGDLDPLGFFAWHEGEGASYMQRPVSEPRLLEEFRTAFGLRRAPHELGLSVAIPYPAEKLRSSDLARAVISQFFLPILSGELIVELHDANQSVVLSGSTLLEAIDQFKLESNERERLRRHVLLAIWALGEGQRVVSKLARPSRPTQPNFSESMISSSDRAGLSERLISGRRLAIRVPVPVEPRATPSVVWSHVDVYLEYDRNNVAKEDIYVRKGLALVDHSGQARQPGLRSILIAQDGPVYEMLRASENVAHTKWRQRGADRLGQQYTRGSSKISYVLGVVPSLVQALLSPDDEADWWTLADLFPEREPSPLPEGDGAAAEEPPGSGTPRERTLEEDHELEFEPPPPSVREWRAAPIRGGLRVRANPAYEGPLRQMSLVAAYGLLNRRGFRAHDPADFSFRDNPAMVEASGASFRPVDHNRLEMSPTNREFRIDIKGFDARRALDYRITVGDASTSTEDD